MGKKLPLLPWREVAKALVRQGFRLVNVRGSHITFYHPDRDKYVTVIMKKEIPRGTLEGILDKAQKTREEFFKILGLM